MSDVLCAPESPYRFEFEFFGYADSDKGGARGGVSVGESRTSLCALLSDLVGFVCMCNRRVVRRNLTPLPSYSGSCSGRGAKCGQRQHGARGRVALDGASTTSAEKSVESLHPEEWRLMRAGEGLGFGPGFGCWARCRARCVLDGSSWRRDNRRWWRNYTLPALMCVRAMLGVCATPSHSMLRALSLRGTAPTHQT